MSTLGLGRDISSLWLPRAQSVQTSATAVSSARGLQLLYPGSIGRESCEQPESHSRDLPNLTVPSQEASLSGDRLNVTTFISQLQGHVVSSRSVPLGQGTTAE